MTVPARPSRAPSSPGALGTPEVDLDAVTALVERVAYEVVRPRFRDLGAGEVSEKSPGDFVTVADLAAEQALTAGLEAITPGIAVVGEEAVAADPTVLDLLVRPDPTWVVDPIDGTRAFVEGGPDYAVMVSLVEAGVPLAGWVCLPEYGQTFTAVRGGGAWLLARGGRRSPVVLGGGRGGPDDDGGPGDTWGARERAGLASLRGGVGVHYLPAAERDGVAAAVAERAPRMYASRGLWAGATYRRLLTGAEDVVVYWRTNPWDHAAGAALLREAGGVAQRWDGSDYRVDDQEFGLVAATSPRAAHVVRSDLLDR